MQPIVGQNGTIVIDGVRMDARITQSNGHTVVTVADGALAAAEAEGRALRIGDMTVTITVDVSALAAQLEGLRAQIAGLTTMDEVRAVHAHLVALQASLPGVLPAVPPLPVDDTAALSEAHRRTMQTAPAQFAPSTEAAKHDFDAVAASLTAADLRAVQDVLRRGRMLGVSAEHCFFGVIARARGGSYGMLGLEKPDRALEAWIIHHIHFGDTPETSAEAAQLDAWLRAALVEKEAAQTRATPRRDMRMPQLVGAVRKRPTGLTSVRQIVAAWRARRN